ncbi:hypothetical protein evm_013343 [Chilo suppressalis]|nr:hypothetical protein evm_013343 [Chilo suppressalis]
MNACVKNDFFIDEEAFPCFPSALSSAREFSHFCFRDGGVIVLYVRSLASSSVSPHLTLLRRVGYCRLSPGVTGSSSTRYLHEIYRKFALAAILTYTSEQAIYAYQNRRDIEKLAPVLFLFLCHITCIVKKLVFHLDAPRIDQLIAELEDAAYNSQTPPHRAMLRSTASSALRLLRAYVGCAIFTCILWVMFPLVDRLQQQDIEFHFWIPVDYNRPLTFPLVLIYSYYVTTLVAVGNTTMDAFIATMLSQCKTQLSILRMNFEDLPLRAMEMAYNSTSYEAALSKLFLDCIHHYQKISEYKPFDTIISHYKNTKEI